VSYDPVRDNGDLAGLPADAYPRLEAIASLIHQSHWRGEHADQCGCGDSTITGSRCMVLNSVVAWSTPSTEEVLGWLAARGLLDLAAATAYAEREYERRACSDKTAKEATSD
jgi:hypothetical protein